MTPDHYMHLAARLAGRLADRPIGVEPQGCLLVADTNAGPMIAGRGWATRSNSALAQALANRIDTLANAETDLYFAREPDDDEARRVVALKPRSVFIGRESARRETSGQGIELLRKSSVNVSVGIAREAVSSVLAPIDHVEATGRPLVTLKLASSLDGRIATKSGESKWITGEQARRFAHLLRAKSDGILVGANTAVMDNPDLTCRLPGLEHLSPLRIVADSRIRTPLTHKVVAGAQERPTWFVVGPDAEKDRAAALSDAGVTVIEVDYAAQPPDAKGLDMKAVLDHCAHSGLASVFVEGGAALAATLLRQKLVDRVVWFQGPKIIGADGRSALAAMGFDRMGDIVSLDYRTAYRFDGDMAVEYDVE